MIGDQHIETAIAEGVLTREQAVRLREIADRSAPWAAVPLDPDDERFRLIGGFNDVFVTIGVGLLVAALFALTNALGFGVGFSVVGLAAAWGLSEVFARRMRLALPSIALAAMFAGAGALLLTSVLGGLLAATGAIDANSTGAKALLIGSGAALSGAIHERRFHVPVDAAIIAGGMACAIGAALELIAPNTFRDNGSLIFGIFGLVIFAVAVRIDATDPERVTRRSDMAFWLHLMAAPMIVHAAIPLLTGSVSQLSAGQALTILAVFFVLGFVAIVIDRRALLVSGLSYAGIAIAYLLSKSPAKDMSAALTLLGLAALVLGLSVGWRHLRAAILPIVPMGQFRRFVPPTIYTAPALPDQSIRS
jgi:hypothetical protein